MEIDTRIEMPPHNIVERLARLEEHKQHVATKADIKELQGIIDTNFADQRGFIKDTVKDSKIDTLKGFLKLWTTIVSIAVPAATAMVVGALNILLK